MNFSKMHAFLRCHHGTASVETRGNFDLGPPGEGTLRIQLGVEHNLEAPKCYIDGWWSEPLLQHMIFGNHPRHDQNH